MNSKVNFTNNFSANAEQLLRRKFLTLLVATALAKMCQNTALGAIAVA
jgi:hypothetical protein